MQRIELSQNKVVLLDDEDFPRFSHYHWCYRGERNGGPGYAIRHIKEGKKTRNAYLHREVMAPVPPGHEVIFLNGDRLDCRRANLRVVTVKEARQHHGRARSDSQSGLKGISYNWRPRTWSVDINLNGQFRRVGTFLTQKEALDAYQEALRQENPDLYQAPDVIERQVERPGEVKEGPA